MVDAAKPTRNEEVRMSATDVITIDTLYTGVAKVAAAYLVVEDGQAAFIETNTSSCVPTLLQALADAGLTVADVKYVIITHIHLDHAGGAGTLMAACPNAILLAHPKAAPHAIDPARIIAGATAVYGQRAFDELYGVVEPVPADRVQIMADNETVTLGQRTLTFLHTRGHANHHFCVYDDASNSIFTGDSFGVLYPHMQGNGTLALASTSPTDFDGPAAHASVDRIVATGAKTVYPTHFGPHTDLTTAATQIHAQITEYEAVVDHALENDLQDDALDAYCSRRAKQIIEAQLVSLGHDTAEAATGIVATDVDLNGQGIAFAVRKIRFKQSRR
ncbi:MAG: glyoxylase-like metal-dependent hydrolase (beta-lactamase superfamily II) [Myxococcota bacterium]